MAENLQLRRRIAEALLGCELDDAGFAPCPGAAMHNAKTGRRDFQVCLDGAPTGRCFHASCAVAVAEFNRRLRSEIGKAEAGGAGGGSGSNGGGARRPPSLGPGIPPAPKPPSRPKRPPYDPARLADFAGRAPLGPAELSWWGERSPVPVPAPDKQGPEDAAAFLHALYRPGERVLVFAKQYSQGDFLVEAGGGCFRLADRPGVAAVPSPLPSGGPEGLWFLANPVKGAWLPNPNNRDKDGGPQRGRRHGACVTAWRFAVLESDEAPAALWLRALCQLPLPLAALYTSGGRSVHALVRFDAGSKAEWDSLRDDLLPILCPLGADPAALTAVRLTRLPCALRHGTRSKSGKVARYPAPRLQRLLWLNPGAPAAPVLDYVTA